MFRLSTILTVTKFQRLVKSYTHTSQNPFLHRVGTRNQQHVNVMLLTQHKRLSSRLISHDRGCMHHTWPVPIKSKH